MSRASRTSLLLLFHCLLWRTKALIVHKPSKPWFSRWSPASTRGSGRLLAAANLPKLKAAVLVPGFLNGAEEYGPMVEALSERGIPTVVVPMPGWHWYPSLAGRSIRPILERVDFTVRHLCAAGGDVSKMPSSFEYNMVHFIKDMHQTPGGIFKVGGSDKPDEYPHVQPEGNFVLPPEQEHQGRIALIGHSAGGWISRIYLSSREFAGKVYGGSRFVHSLITLGTPHANGVGPAFAALEWANRYPDEIKHIRTLAVASKGFHGSQWGGLTKGSYAFCCPDGTDGTSYDGDGMTPVQCALGLNHAQQLLLENTHHFPWSDVFGGNIVSPELAKHYKEGNPWYGSETAMDKWVDFLHQ